MSQLVLFTLVLGLNSCLPRLPLQSSNCLKGLGSICQSHPEYSDVTCKKKNSTVDQHVSLAVSSLLRLFSVALSGSTKPATCNSCKFAILQFLHLPIICKTSSWNLRPLSLFSNGVITSSFFYCKKNSNKVFIFVTWIFFQIKKLLRTFHFATKAKRCRSTQYFEKCTNRLVKKSAMDRLDLRRNVTEYRRRINSVHNFAFPDCWFLICIPFVLIFKTNKTIDTIDRVGVNVQYATNNNLQQYNKSQGKDKQATQWNQWSVHCQLGCYE